MTTMSGAANAECFMNWTRKRLAAKDIVILDNVQAQKDYRFIAAVEARGARWNSFLLIRPT